MGAHPRRRRLVAHPSPQRPGGTEGVGCRGDHRRRHQALTLQVEFPGWGSRRDGWAGSPAPVVMGVVNVTPDSFSDGGAFSGPDDAIAAGIAMWQAGADLIDVGGESTRPGSEGVDAATEISRVIPVVTGLAEASVAVSIDTSKPDVAEAALDAGAIVVNDVTALGADGMPGLVADSGCGVVLMHMLGEPRTMQDAPEYDDVSAEVTRYLLGRAEAALDAGVERHRIALDPGIGFGKTVEHNLILITEGVRALAATGFDVLVGASRKAFLGHIAGEAEPSRRSDETVAAHVAALLAGARIIRAHDVDAAVGSSMIAGAIVAAVGSR